MSIFETLKQTVGVDVKEDEKTREEFSRDTSLFKVDPDAVAFPETPADIGKLVNFVTENKAENPDLNLTARSAGTDMTGGPLGESLIVSFTENMDAVKEISQDHAVVQPGVYYRDFEKKILPEHLTMPTYPASKSIAALGGMLMNNCGGEKTLRYGQMREFVNTVNMVLRDGNEYTFGPISFEKLKEKKELDTLEGEIYRKVDWIIEENWDAIQAAKPKTSKNSSGYAIWRVKDKEHETFDLSHLFVGSQGTLGIMTEANVKLQPEKPHERLVALFFDSWDQLPEVVNTLLPLDPESIETFDDDTLKLGLRFMPEIARRTGQNLLSFALKFLPEAWIGVQMLGLPKLIILVELAEETEEELDRKTKEVEDAVKDFDLKRRTLHDNEEAEKYWVMRRQSFALLREHVKGKQTAPFVEDFCVDPKVMPEFLPKALDILERYDIQANIAGHAANGNYHIIPLMDLTEKTEREKIVPCAKEFYDLVLEYGGTITAEHNDGIIRTPFVKQMFGDQIYSIFEDVKNIFDPDNIFNPGKKVGGDLEYVSSHIVAKKED